MASVIFVILIVVVSLVTTITKQKQQKQKKQGNSQEYVSTGTYSEPTSYNSDSRYRSTSQKKTNTNTMKNRANVGSPSASSSAYNTQEFRRMAGVESDDGAILSAAKMHSLATELGNEYDSKEDLMAPVFDLMVKGPDTSIPNERDFVSEGMDMINTYTLES